MKVLLFSFCTPEDCLVWPRFGDHCPWPWPQKPRLPLYLSFLSQPALPLGEISNFNKVPQPSSRVRGRPECWGPALHFLLELRSPTFSSKFVRHKGHRPSSACSWSAAEKGLMGSAWAKTAHGKASSSRANSPNPVFL